jgi:threonine 3-dehydrogenase
MRKEIILITGANGEIGHGLISFFGKQTKEYLVTIDVQPLDENLKPYVFNAIQGDILDGNLLERLVAEYDIRTIFHLASILSTKAEYNPEVAHKVNVDGTVNLLKLAADQSRWQERPIKFIYPSSIAVYGIPNIQAKNKLEKVRESDCCTPITMYGCNKLYCENLGHYYSRYYRQLSSETDRYSIDFRALRFPGLISAQTIPTGGTSDYGPEMLHHAAQNQPYTCFVRRDTRIPFMAMPDAIKALTQLESASLSSLSQLVYNVGSFNPTAEEFQTIVKQYFPKALTTFQPDKNRQNIIDSWPGNVDDSSARNDWIWEPDYDLGRAFKEYLVPAIKKRYKKNR